MATGTRKALSLSKCKLVYGKGQHGVLEANLQVDEGNIYALLGPSGCGKTTLLNVIVGLKRLDSGQVLVHGYPPHSVGSGVPGSQIGYMPQEPCLASELTSEETLRYFGLLHGLATIQDRISFLMNLFQLPKKRLVKNLSGGQQKRLSLAVAMVHDPPLLILDEPTVGFDPVLRNIAWKHFLDITNRKGRTVLVTTHYIEEASEAHVVGLMRGGKVLLQNSPQQVLTRFQVSSLESAFLLLCKDQETHADSDHSEIHEEHILHTRAKDEHEFEREIKSDRNEMIRRSSEQETEEEWGSTIDIFGTVAVSDAISLIKSVKEDKINAKQRQNNRDENIIMSLKHVLNSVLCGSKTDRTELLNSKENQSWYGYLLVIYGITWKHSLTTRRNIGVLLLAFLMPVCLLLMAKILLHDPHGIRVAMVNDEKPPYLSLRFIREMDKNILNVKTYSNLQEARNLLMNGNVKGVIYIASNFSQSLLEKSHQQNKTDYKNSSCVHLYTDTTNLPIWRTIYNSLLDSYKSFARFFGGDDRSIESHLKFEKSVQGVSKPDMGTFFLTNAIPDTIFLMAMGYTAVIFVNEKSSGFYDRNLVAGVKTSQFFVSQFLTHSCVTLVQVIIVSIFMLVIKMEMEGNFITLWILLFQSSYLGMAIGILISAFECGPKSALFIINAIYWCGGSTTGVIWPAEGQAPGMRVISQIQPLNWNYQAVRMVIQKGLGLNNILVWRSLLLSCGWILLLLTVAIIIAAHRGRPLLLKRKQGS